MEIKKNVREQKKKVSKKLNKKRNGKNVKTGCKKRRAREAIK
jgi:hypothetical protein